MNNPKKIFQELLYSIDWVDLTFLILNSCISLAITHQLGYLIKWKYSGLFIFWMLFFYLGNEFLGYNLNQGYSEEDHAFQRTMDNVFRLFAVLFFSMSIIPLVQILLVSFSNYLVIYLICILGFWLLIKNILMRRIKIFGISESISSFVISLITPMTVLNINGIRIHEILLPISFFSFLQIIAYKFVKEINEIYKRTNVAGFTLAYIGYNTILKTITILIPFSYISCLFLLFLQSRDQFIKPLLFSIPFAAFFGYKISRVPENKKENVKLLETLALVFVLLVEVLWIVGLWFS